MPELRLPLGIRQTCHIRPCRPLCAPAGCQKDFILANYGDRFAKAGLASFIFDYRSFGGSEGEPRHWVSTRKHIEDYMSAVQFIKAELSEAVDVNRINLWGTSFAGGHVLELAGTRLRDNVTAVVAQVSCHSKQALGVETHTQQQLGLLPTSSK